MTPQQTLLAFVNRRDLGPKDFDEAFEITGRDIGEKLGENILLQRTNIGGFFKSLGELQETPQIGPARLKLMLEVAATNPARLNEWKGSVRPKPPTPPSPSTLKVNDFQPKRLPTLGGTRIELRGEFVVGMELEVFLKKGSRRTQCIGRDMQPVVKSVDGKTLRLIAPQLVAADGYEAEVRHKGKPYSVLKNAVSVIPATFGDGVFEQRSLYPEWAATGPRSMSSS